ncbi:MAG: EAL domain-containing protein [Mycobacterium sp.]
MATDDAPRKRSPGEAATNKSLVICIAFDRGAAPDRATPFCRRDRCLLNQLPGPLPWGYQSAHQPLRAAQGGRIPGGLMGLTKIVAVSGVSAVSFGIFAVWLITGWGGEHTGRLVSDLGLPLAELLAIACAATAARAGAGRDRWGWSALAVGLVGYAVGDGIWAYHELWRGYESAPFPSVGDAGYLLYPIGACLALLMFPTGNRDQSQARLALDGVIVAGSFFVISWVSGLRELVESGSESAFAHAVSLAYPLADVVLITVALLVLTRARAGRRGWMGLLTLGIALTGLADSAFVLLNVDDGYQSGNLIDLAWFAGLLLMAVAALLATRAPPADLAPPRLPPNLALWLIYVPVLVATTATVLSLASETGSVTLLVGAFVVINSVLARQFIVLADNRRLLVKAAEQAFRDPLTGLANRALFQDRLSHAVTLQQRDAREVAVLSLDLDDFKLVNDALGHPAGDALLTAVADRLLVSTESGDTVARLGGDEFAILIEDGTESPLARAHRVLEAFDQPFVVDGQQLYMHPSIGLASGTAEENPESSAAALLKQADVAMYSGKRARAGGVQIFSTDMNLIDIDELNLPREPTGRHSGRGTAGMQLLGQLRQAIADDQLTLVYQPKFSVSTGEIVGTEALVRWPHPERGLLMPDQFLPLVRQHGLMGAITDCVLRRGIAEATTWYAEGVGVQLAVNLFPPSLADAELPDRIARTLAERGLPAEYFMVEITEDILVGNIDRARRVLNRLRESGIGVALDDFGIGYSALNYLRELPIDQLKLDRQFIAPILHDDRAAAIVRVVIELAHTLEMTVVAEGIENAAAATKLAGYGCDIIQAHFYSPPVSGEEMLSLLTARTTAGVPPHRS